MDSSHPVVALHYQHLTALRLESPDASYNSYRHLHLYCTTHNTATIPDKMANACAHQFRMIKSDNTLVQWICQHCRSGPHWMIWECTYCKLHLCRPCTQSA
ncbi:Uncharacterized protein HZ326_11184 [Fusarium oxysporum f. sp. albedinis]|nr:Uncharacterized protein HZ326_11184 [Fusarium oxysporum f. sp. albedinis]